MSNENINSFTNKIGENKISDRIIEIIGRKEIVPEPKWKFVCRDCSLFFFLICLFFASAFAVSVVIFFIVSGYWDISRYFGGNLFEEIVLSVSPAAWVFVSALLLVAAFFVFKNTKRGYKYRKRVFFIVSSLILLALGIFLFLARLKIGLVMLSIASLLLILS